MTRKKTKQAKGRTLYGEPDLSTDNRNHCTRLYSDKGWHYNPSSLVKYLVLDASDAGREALQIDLTKIFADWLFRSDSNEQPMDAVMRRIGFPAPSKKGRK